MIQISKITFKDIELEDVVFSDGVDLMALLKDLGKEKYISKTMNQKPLGLKKKKEEEEEKKEIAIEDIKKNSKNQNYQKTQKLNILDL